MIKLKSLVSESNYPKNKWVEPDKDGDSEELIDLVKTAYKRTPEGSFVNSKGDVVSSEWLAIDCDEVDDLDATIFYRKPRGSESWRGKKIQGIGHDGTKQAVKVVLGKLTKILNESGVWVEASDRLEEILYKSNVPFITDQNVLQKVFNSPELAMVGDKGRYRRKIGNKTIQETVFGKPIL